MSRLVPNREDWLRRLKDGLAPTYKALGAPLPDNVKMTCGFTSKGARKPSDRTETIGQCWYPAASAEGFTEIFIHPKLADAMEVGGVVLHELSHAALGPGFGHGREFKELATALGLEGKMTATSLAEAGKERLEKIISRIGDYPHAALDPGAIAEGGPRPQAFHQHLNLNCPECGFHAKVWAKQMHMGRLLCPVDGKMLLTKEERAGLMCEAA